MVGIDKEQDFGNPQTVQNLGDTSRQVAADLQRFIDTVNRDVAATVPDHWGGEGATAFQRFWFRFSQRIAGLGSPIDYYGRELAVAAETMQRARQKLAAAHEFARANGLRIGQNLVVEAIDPSRPGAQAAVAQGQRLVEEARQLAELAQQQIRRANEVLAVTGERAVAEMLEVTAAIAGGGSGRGGRRRRPPRSGGQLGGGSGRRRRGTDEEESQMLYGPEGKVRRPREGSGRWVNEDGTPGIPGDSIFIPNNPRAFGIHPNNPQEIRFREGVPDLRQHSVPPHEMPNGWGGTTPHVTGLRLTGRDGDAALADAVAGRHIGMTQDQFHQWRRDRGFIWHHYSHHEMTLVPNVVHAPLAHQGPFR